MIAAKRRSLERLFNILKSQKNKKSKIIKSLTFSVDKSQKVNYYIVKVERTKGQKIRKSN